MTTYNFLVPPEHKSFFQDWNEQDLFSDDTVYDTEDGYVKVGDEKEYMSHRYHKITIEQVIENKRGVE